jgi:hypothetical protein
MTHRKLRTILSGIVLLATLSAAPSLHAAEHEDFDAYRLKVDASWYYVSPSGNFHGANDSGTVDINKDLGFGNYNTFAGKADWKFTRKNHLYLSVIPLYFSRQTVLNRTFTFQGQTFNAGLTASSSLDNLLLAPGYQYDIIRRKRGHLGIAVQMDLFDITTKINSAAQVTGNGVHYNAVSASGSLLAPIPVAGPDFRYYLTNSPRVFINGNVLGMYLFGYGNFVSSTGTIGVKLVKHLSVTGGYQLGSALTVKGTQDRLAFRFVQKGALAGLEASF